MAHLDVHFVHKPLVQVKTYGVSVSLYPVLDASMSAAERAHGFHVIKNNLLAANLTPQQLLNALGQQTGQSAVVDGAIAGFLRHFHDRWRNFRNLTILSWHDSAGAIINNTTTPGDTSILLPVQNGLLVNCRQQDIMFVRVQVAVDYSYAIRGVAPVRLDFYIELPQTSTAMINGGGVAYTLVTYSGPADLRTLDTEQSATSILDVTYQTRPGQIVAAVFGATSATLNQDRAMTDIESRILRVVDSSIFKDVFLASAPNYTDQPEAALEHVYQVITDAEGKQTCRSVQEYYTQIMAALQPFIKERTFPVNAAEKFKTHLDPALFPFFKQAYPSHSNVVALDSALQLTALRDMLSAAQLAEDNRNVISKAAVTAINAQSFVITGAASAGVNASQAERTIGDYKKRELTCFGCGGPHAWSKRQADDTYTEVCPNKDKAGVRAAAKEKIAEIRTKRKARKEQYEKRKKAKTTTANAAFDNLTAEQKVLCLEEATRISSTTTPSASSASSTSTRKVFVVTVEVFSAEPNRPIMPISIQSNLPHMVLSLGPDLDIADCPDIRCAIDTCAGLNTGYYPYLMALAKRYPHCLHKLFTSREYAPIVLSGIVQNGDSAITTTLDCTFQFHLPYKLRGDGGDCLISIAAGANVAVNVILGMPFITAMKMIVDFVDNVATCNALDHPPFPIDFRRPSTAVPAPDAGANVSTRVDDTVLQLESYEQWRTAQAALSRPSAIKVVHFGPDAEPPSLAASPGVTAPTALSVSTLSESQNLLHHNVQRLEGFM